MKFTILLIFCILLLANGNFITKLQQKFKTAHIRAHTNAISSYCPTETPYLCQYGCQAYDCNEAPPSSEPSVQSSSSAVIYESSSSSSTAPTYESSSSSTAPVYESSSSSTAPTYESSSTSSPTYESSSSSTAPTYESSSSSTAPVYETSSPTYESSSTAPTYESSSSSTAPTYESSSSADYVAPTCATILCQKGYVCQNATCVRGPCFTDVVKIWIDENKDSYTQWVNTANSLYDQYGYYVDPKKQTDSYKPVTYLNPGDFQYETCYQDQYTSTGYSTYGYDSKGYDPYGYDQSGYDRNGWSRYGADSGTQFNCLGQLKNPEYSDQRCYFYPNGTVKLNENGEVLRYDRYGYDQYGNDINGYPNPSLCPDQPTGGRPNLPPQKPPTEGLLQSCPYPHEYQRESKYFYVRKSITAMTPDDWTRFRGVWNSLNMLGKVGDYVKLYRSFYDAEQVNSLRLLPWMREFLARFENEMHTIDPCVVLPYWDTTVSPIFPLGLAAGVQPNFPPDARFYENGVLMSSDPVTRQIGALGSLPAAPLLSVLMQDSNFASFSGKLTQYQNTVHAYIGGDMLNIISAAQDPVFYCVHAYIDWIWSQWQANNEAQPDEATINQINPLTYGPNDNRNYDDVKAVESVQTTRGIGYGYI